MPEPKQKSVTKTQNKVGRPTTYTPELAALICEQIGLGKSMRSVLKGDDMPAMSSVFLWLREHKDFSEQYARACEERTEAMAEDIIDISDESSRDFIETEDGRQIPNNEAIQRSKLRVDTRKWLMAKMKPKKYGDKMEIDNTHRIITPILGGATKDEKVIDQE